LSSGQALALDDVAAIAPVSVPGPIVGHRRARFDICGRWFSRVVAQEAKGSSCLIFKITDWNF